MPEMIDIAAKDGGSFKAYVAMPEKTPAPVIIVIQEIFGVNQDLRDKCDNLAAQGYIAVCPDLFWRIEPGIELTDKTDAEWQRAFELFQLFNVDRGIEDLRATLNTFRGYAGSTGKVGCVGYCLGGKLAYLMACRSDIDCSAGYYGVNIENMLEEAGDIENPLLLHIAEKDEYVPPEAQQRIREALGDHPLVTIYSYPGVNHAFARGNGQNYNKEAAAKADSRTGAFFKSNLF